MLIIGIAGGTGSGKTTVVRKILERLPEGEVVILPQDSYYKDSSHLPLEERLEINFDHPDSIEFELLVKHLKDLRKGKQIEQPIYSYLTCTRAVETIPVNPCHVIIIEGILVLTNPELRKMMDLKVFVDADADDRLIRVINRDIVERGRSVNKVMERYENTVKPMHLQFIEPSKRFADLIIPQGGNNHIAIDILTKYIENKLSSEQLSIKNKTEL
jgi:uridine kinase